MIFRLSVKIMFAISVTISLLAFSVQPSHSFLFPDRDHRSASSTRSSVGIRNRHSHISLLQLGGFLFSTKSTSTGASASVSNKASSVCKGSKSNINLKMSAATDAAADTSTDTENNASTPESIVHKKQLLEDVSPSYTKLVTQLKSITQLKRTSAVLDYDRMVLMPQSDASSKQRGKQLSVLASIIHEKATDESIPSLIETSIADLEKLLSSQSQSEQQYEYKDERRILQLTKEAYEKKIRIPSELEARKAELSSAAYSSWVKAREAKDFDMFAPTLKDCFATAMEVATSIQTDDTDTGIDGTGEKKSLYTQMLDEFEMGMKGERIDEIFSQIESALKPLIQKVLTSQHKPSTNPLKGKFEISKQKEINEKIITTMGFHLDHGRIDQSVHPFTMSFGPADVRITSRFNEDEWFQGLAATIHEGGHAMYEQNIGDSDLDIDEHLSMGMHESQSLFWERHVGMSKEFCNWSTSIFKETFDDFTYDANDVYDAINAVEASPIRVEADELTYPLHVILRYKIERETVDGRMEVNDIPKHWNQQMKDVLNVTIENDALGCLQDVHWSALAIGYFPTYLIGSATAAQLAFYCKKDNPDMYQQIEQGEFGQIKSWLTDKVHRHGRRYESLDALLEDQLGEPLNPKYFIDYLSNKYTELYKCDT
mmetsp:Transcript_8518/g.9367  ORF Transcript_8518/g.9367 Transcript_8518/m.9367 type:complete len:656 (+) Transcript_8518:1-1968(+)